MKQPTNQMSFSLDSYTSENGVSRSIVKSLQNILKNLFSTLISSNTKYRTKEDNDCKMTTYNSHFVGGPEIFLRIKGLMMI